MVRPKRLISRNWIVLLTIFATALAMTSSPSALAESEPPWMTADAGNDAIWGGGDWGIGVELVIEIDDPTTSDSPDHATTAQMQPTEWDPSVLEFWVEVGDVIDLRPGFEIAVTDSIRTKTLTLTPLGITEIDLTGDTVSGTADEALPVHIDAVDQDGNNRAYRIVDASGGAFSADFATPGSGEEEQETADLVEGWRGTAQQYDEDGDYTHASWDTWVEPEPMAQIRFDPIADMAEGSGWSPGATVSLTFDDPGTADEPDCQFSYPVDQGGDYRFYLDESSPTTSCDPAPGWSLSVEDGASTQDLVIVPLEITDVDWSTFAVEGLGIPGETIQVQGMIENDPWRTAIVESDTDGDGLGTWSVDFATPTIDDDPSHEQTIEDLPFYLQFRAYRFDDENTAQPDTDATIHDATLPRFDTNNFGPPFGNPAIEGSSWPYGAVVEITVTDAQGGEVFVDSTVVDGVAQFPGSTELRPPEEGFFHFFEFPEGFAFQPGWIVTVTAPEHRYATKIHEVSTLTITDADPTGDGVFGTADPGTDVVVFAPCWSEPGPEDPQWWGGATSRYVTTEQDGTWHADFSSAGPGLWSDFGLRDQPACDIKLGDELGATQFDDDYDTSGAQFRIPNPTFMVEPPYAVGASSEDWELDSTITIEIDDPATTATDTDFSGTTTVVPAEHDPEVGWWWFDLSEVGFEIRPGFVVTASDGATTKTLEVLDVIIDEIDASSDTVRGTAASQDGTALAEVMVGVNVDNESGHAFRMVTTDAAGVWEADFSVSGEGEGEESQAFDIVPETGVGAFVADEDGDSTNRSECYECESGGIEPIPLGCGQLLISETDGTLWAYDPVEGELSDHPLPFGGIWDIQWLAPDIVLIAQSAEARIWVLDLATGQLEVVVEGDPLGFPIGLALDRTTDSLWIADHAAGILRLTSEGIEVVIQPLEDGPMDGIVTIDGAVFFTNQTGTLYRIDGPDSATPVVDVGDYALNGLTQSSDGSILATSTWPPALVTIDPDDWSFTIDDYADTMHSPEDSATTATGEIYVIDSGANPDFGDDPGLFLRHPDGAVELLVGDVEGFGDTVDLLVAEGTSATIVELRGPDAPLAIGGEASVNGTFLVPDSPAAHDVYVDWDDGTPPEQIEVENHEEVDEGFRVEVMAAHTYGRAGVYEVTMTVTAACGGTSVSETYSYVVVYDPDDGFVTGGGWIDSPAGAYVPDPTLEGPATFGFVAKYKKGAKTPTGNTEFQFHAGDMDFRSESYQWLVVAGPKAMFKGVGTINGGGTYGFLLTAVDEALTPSTDVDLFRMKIWDIDAGDAVVYDNELAVPEGDDPTTAIAGGSIVIHTSKGR